MTREKKVIKARAYFDKMSGHIYSVDTIEGLYAATIRRYVAEGVTTWEELGFTDSDVEERLQQAKMRSVSTV